MFYSTTTHDKMIRKHTEALMTLLEALQVHKRSDFEVGSIDHLYNNTDPIIIMITKSINILPYFSPIFRSIT